MSDIKCAVCGEPWNAYGVADGDMLRWEADLFRAGAGCPACEGVAPEGVEATEAHLRSVVMEAESPDGFGLLAGTTAPKWAEPDEPVLAQCDCCPSEIRRSHEDNEPYWYRIPRHRAVSWVQVHHC